MDSCAGLPINSCTSPLDPVADESFDPVLEPVTWAIGGFLHLRAPFGFGANLSSSIAATSQNTEQCPTEPIFLILAPEREARLP